MGAEPLHALGQRGVPLLPGCGACEEPPVEHLPQSVPATVEGQQHAASGEEGAQHLPGSGGRTCHGLPVAGQSPYQAVEHAADRADRPHLRLHRRWGRVAAVLAGLTGVLGIITVIWGELGMLSEVLLAVFVFAVVLTWAWAELVRTGVLVEQSYLVHR